MAYATVSNVSALDRGRDPFTPATKPTDAEVVRFLEQRAGEIDVILRTRDYLLPVATTYTGVLAMLELYNAQGADCLVQQAAVNSNRRKEACQAWEAAKTLLETGDIGIPIDGNSFGIPTTDLDRDPIFSFATGALSSESPWF